MHPLKIIAVIGLLGIFWQTIRAIYFQEIRWKGVERTTYMHEQPVLFWAILASQLPVMAAFIAIVLFVPWN